uniref:Uncharacterized protein n=1 Tax=Ditylenchus dipsaci TaxID=166011 RepID=A0A915E8W4_9BILA
MFRKSMKFASDSSCRSYAYSFYIKNKLLDDELGFGESFRLEVKIFEAKQRHLNHINLAFDLNSFSNMKIDRLKSCLELVR